MKYLLALVSTSALADDLPTAAAPSAIGGNYGWLIALIAFVLAVCGFIWWSRNRAKAEATTQSILQRVAPAIPTLNTPVIVPPASVAVPIQTPASAPSGSAPQPGEGLWPYAQRMGVDVRANGLLLNQLAVLHPGEGWDQVVDRLQHPEHFFTPADVDTVNAARARDQAAANQTYSGPVPVTSLNDQDKAALNAIRYTDPQFPWRVFSGTRLDIDNAINWATQNPQGPFDLNTYQGVLRLYMK